MTGSIVDVIIPSDQFALAHTLAELETVTVDAERIAATNDEFLLSFLRFDSPERATLEAMFAEDDSVVDFRLIAEFESDCLYQFEWDDHIEHLVRLLVEQEGTVLRATGHDDHWNIRLLFADRMMATRTNDCCLEHGIDFDVTSIHDLTDQSSSRVGLTDRQQTTLQLAAEHGYYSVPREVKAEDLAEEIGISHQALSERLRRAHGNLVNHVLRGGKRGVNSVESAPAESKLETSGN
ncbi:helix-turn-helix domain-containing protein [Haladaptatus sp. T7]|uniref:helix-turn-helix domain-containing protein n=1 Tax=Haladaptatus sp. T7 TaxID=2029368 RepID=UPI0021A259E1|nr:helix-turn-helix domain-containing protein [Haladaptatus sp. T7]GKZ14729.1 bacteriocin [Haladaptatus sp. T7]